MKPGTNVDYGLQDVMCYVQQKWGEAPKARIMNVRGSMKMRNIGRMNGLWNVIMATDKKQKIVLDEQRMVKSVAVAHEAS